MLQLTLTADYALRAVVYIASKGLDRYVPAAEIAQEQQIPRLYVSKILQCLTRSEIISTIPGRKGGAKLQRYPDEISVFEVIEAVDGSVSLNRCLSNSEQCSRSSFCKIRPFWVKTQKSLVNTLGQARISHFVNSAV
ncbi:MAG: RrF2 family transcriptional regulator [Planctomycetota bacterium]|jgi:Rrf2 family protein